MLSYIQGKTYLNWHKHSKFRSHRKMVPFLTSSFRRLFWRQAPLTWLNKRLKMFYKIESRCPSVSDGPLLVKDTLQEYKNTQIEITRLRIAWANWLTKVATLKCSKILAKNLHKRSIFFPNNKKELVFPCQLHDLKCQFYQHHFFYISWNWERNATKAGNTRI